VGRSREPGPSWKVIAMMSQVYRRPESTVELALRDVKLYSDRQHLVDGAIFSMMLVSLDTSVGIYLCW
jgi:hypothetical protein